MTAIPIDDADDPRIAPFRAVRDRDLARQDGRFVVEGEVAVRLLLSRGARFPAEALLVLDAPPGRALAAEFGEGLPVHMAGRAVMDRIVGFPIHRGVLAVARRPDALPLRGVIPAAGPALVLVLCGISNHDNVGGAFRNAAAFGADAVLLDATSCDPLYRKAIRVSAGASLLVPFARGGPSDELLAELAGQDFQIFALSPAGRRDLSEVAWAPRSALVLGAEGPGLPAAILARWTTVRIAMRAGFDSLNVATAAGIALHAASRLAGGD
ncbi:RNA methyltransferase [Enterovirga sp.]|jgi:tRNA G18 (ribose-2'-O)-methylase SpoU|uniref:TrmH family RNA methyltransferase n=1 Tax=Enterovirga sp. TaxID=2026350 RepID=UPI0026255DE8|nr:RNA methyltransferase [Enterovirga sp.]MDB5590193.1 methyltransferase [Enterovirga sp.]